MNYTYIYKQINKMKINASNEILALRKELKKYQILG